MERLPAVLVPRGDFRPPRCQVLRHREMAIRGGEVERPSTALVIRGDFRPPPGQVLRNGGMAIGGGDVEDLRVLPVKYDRARRRGRDFNEAVGDDAAQAHAAVHER